MNRLFVTFWLVIFSVDVLPVEVELEGDQKEDSCDDLFRLAFPESNQHVWISLSHVRLIESECENSPYYYQFLATLEMFVGNHRAALGYWDKNFTSSGPIEDRGNDESWLPQGAKSVEAVPYIVEQARDRQVVIVNERHHVSTDRLLTLSLLEPLARQGYRYLAVEAVGDPNGVGDGHVAVDTGYYVNDVVFAEMLRTAVSLGYEIVPYEIEEDQKLIDDSRTAQARRDYWQARNLLDRTLAGDPDAKVLVHCGWGHVQEIATDRWSPMAYFFSELTDIDPLTVDQTLLAERSERKFEHVWRVQAEQRGLLKSEPIVLVGEEGELLAPSSGVDVRVMLPSTVYQDGRPTWMRMAGRRHAVRVETPECKDVCILEARGPDSSDSVPYDRLELNGQESGILYLPNGTDVELFLYGLDGKLLGRRAINR